MLDSERDFKEDQIEWRDSDRKRAGPECSAEREERESDRSRSVRTAQPDVCSRDQRRACWMARISATKLEQWEPAGDDSSA